MKIFISHRHIDKEAVHELLKEIPKDLGFEYLNHYKIEESDELWKDEVAKKLKTCELVLFFIGAESANSIPVNWEYNETLKLGKPYKVVHLANPKMPKYLKDEVGVIPNNSLKIISTITNMKFKSNQTILFEQYKIMVNSTEKVTEQRLKVSNLFFTVTTSLLSISVLVGKIIGFANDNTALLSAGVMLVFAVLAFVISFYWEKLINSYGKLNKGKFKLINEIEDELKTNLFQREWEILQNEVGYESNTKTETRVVKRFRGFIIILGVIEIVYILSILCN